jgi:3-isopropylmalate/(R)-2-methylmalate dehydratase small subunit
MIIKGKVWKFGDDIDTDLIIPAQYLNATDETFLARHCLESIHADFYKSVRPGDIIVAGRNFGCGSSREHAPLAIKGCKIAAVVAKSFARIFFRNAINIGLPLVVAPEIVDELSTGDPLSIDLARGEIARAGTNGKKRIYRTEPFPDFLRGVISRGGLMNYQKARMTRKGGGRG